MNEKTVQLNAQQLTNAFLKLYAENKFNAKFDTVTDALFTQVLSARGYLNASDSAASGEDFFIREVLAPTEPELCIDIGANIGDYSLELLMSTNSRVVAFEPLLDPFDLLSRRTSAFRERIDCENLGIGATNTNGIIHFNPERTYHASFSEEVKEVFYVTNEMQQNVPIVTLDSYCEDKGINSIDFVKIDVEGFEKEVFSGADLVFSRIKPKFIQMEFNLHQLFRDTSLKYFADQLPDYAVYQLLPGRWIKRDPCDPLSNIYHFSNFVFVKDG